MKVELEIPSDQIGETVVELFNKLDEESKKRIAEQVMAGFLAGKRFSQQEELVFREQAIAELRKDYGYGHFDPDNWSNRDKISKRIEELERLHGGSRVALAKIFAKEVHTYFMGEVQRLVREDPDIQAAIKATVETVKELFPRYVHDAMLAYFSTQMGALMNGVQSTMMTLGSNESRLNLLEQKMGKP